MDRDAMTICVNCRYLDDTTAGLHICTAKEARLVPAVDPVTGREVFRDPNDRSHSKYWGSASPPCSFVNTSGNCPHYAKKEDAPKQSKGGK